MKGTEASVLVLSGLAALTRARELQIDDVPVECATICGPIVELSFKCDVDNSFDELRRLKRRKVDDDAPEPRVARRHHHRRPNQVQADIAATPTLPLDAAVPSSNGEFQQLPQLPQPQDAQQPAAPEASPVFIASLPFAASAADPQLSTPGVQVTPSDAAQATPQPSSSSSSSSPPPPQQPPPPPPPPPPQATSVLVVPVFAQPTSTVFLTVPAPSLPPIPQVTVPAPLIPTIPPIQVSIPPVIVPPPIGAPPPRPAPPPQQPPAVQPPPRPPIQQQPPPAQAPQIPSQQSTTPSQTPQASTGMPSAAPVMGEGPGKKEPDQKPPDDKEGAEKNCICGNKSFDVNLLAGMCQSCIRKSYNRANDMDFIMSQCNFTEATYTPDKDKLAYNVRVVAQKPLLSHSANAMGDAGRLGGGCTMLAAVAVSFVAGMALLI